MAPRRVVERLDIVEDGKLSVAGAGRNRRVEPGVCLQGAPKRLHGGVVVAIAGPAHTAFDPGGGQNLEIIVVHVLAATV